MMDVLQYAAVLIGIVYLITEATIMSPVRVRLVRWTRSLWLASLIYCPKCIGFWVGCALGAGGFYPFDPYLGSHIAAVAVESGFVAMGLLTVWSAYAGHTHVAYEIEAPLWRPHGETTETEDGTDRNAIEDGE